MCYLVTKAIGDTCPIRVCATKEEIANTYPGSTYKSDKPDDPTKPYMAVALMRNRIGMVLDKCNNNLNCSTTDRFITAGFAQNGPGFTVRDMDNIKNNYLDNTGHIDWATFLSNSNEKSALLGNLAQFRRFALNLQSDGYYIPSDYDDITVQRITLLGIR